MPRNAADLVARAKARVKTVTCAEAAQRIARESDLLVVDVREPEEHARGALARAVNVPRGLLEMTITGLAPGENQPILVHCAGGGRAVLAARTLEEMGYRNVSAVDGAFDELRSCCAAEGA